MGCDNRGRSEGLVREIASGLSPPRKLGVRLLLCKALLETEDVKQFFYGSYRIRKKEVESWVAGSTYKSLRATIFRNRRLRVEREGNGAHQARRKASPAWAGYAFSSLSTSASLSRASHAAAKPA
jgi:hypothetical protein